MSDAPLLPPSVYCVKMNEDQENIEQEIKQSRIRTNQRVRQFVQLSFELEAARQVAALKEQLENTLPSSSASLASPSDTSELPNKEEDKVFVHGCNHSVGTIIKREATRRRQDYHSLDVHGKAIISLGLNSILDLSFNYPDAQMAFFQSSQRKQLQERFPPKSYNVGAYSQLVESLKTIEEIYDSKKSFDTNWLNLYKELKRLSNVYDPYIQPEHNDISFCIEFLLKILSIIKNQPYLFDDQVDTSEWDFIVHFWGVITGRLFHGTGLRLKWGDTHLTVHDSVSDLRLKASPRIVHDRVRQMFNVEIDVGAFEAAEEQPGDVKYVGDRCKVMIESKAVIDKLLLDGCLINSVDSLQICGLEIHFGNLTLAEPGLYIGTQFYSSHIDKSLSNMSKYFTLASQLLCFRDQCVDIANKYEDHLTKTRSQRVSSKRTVHDLPNDDLILKQDSTRGSWNPPRTSKTPPPPVPKRLFGNES